MIRADVVGLLTTLKTQVSEENVSEQGRDVLLLNSVDAGLCRP